MDINPKTRAATEQLKTHITNPTKEREIWFHTESKDRKSGLTLKMGVYRSRDLPNEAWTYVLDRQVAIRNNGGAYSTCWERAIMTDVEMLEYLGKQLSYLNRFHSMSGAKRTPREKK